MFFRLFFLFAFFLIRLEAAEKPLVLVSIAPQKFVVEQIAAETVSVRAIVPPGVSSHSYEPGPKEMMSLNEGKIWFRLGDSFEARLIKILHHQTYIVDQREGLPLIEEGGSCCGHAHEGADPHIWLSPKMLKLQAIQIAHTLSQKYPQYHDLYTRNLATFIDKVEKIDEVIRADLLSCAGKFILVAHPSYGYFCRDYGLNQFSIEMAGKEPTPKYTTDLFLKAQTLQIKTIFIQREYSTRGAERLAQELKAQLIYLDPYAENVLENLYAIAQAFKQA